MSKVFVRSINVDEIIIDTNNYNKQRKEYIDSLKGKRKVISYYAFIMLKEIVLKEYNLNIDDLTLKYNEYGKPLFDEFDFNISHSNNIIAIAISKKEIGIDIQLIKDDVNVFAKTLNLKNDSIEVYKHLSKIEAYYKKIGTGINKSSLKNNLNDSIKIEQKILLNNNLKYVLSVCNEDENIQYDIFLN